MTHIVRNIKWNIIVNGVNKELEFKKQGNPAKYIKRAIMGTYLEDIYDFYARYPKYEKKINNRKTNLLNLYNSVCITYVKS